MNSDMRVVGTVPFPEMRGERIYMREVFKHQPLPDDIARWQPTFDAMTANMDFDGPAYLMVDQAFVFAGDLQRRPGVHTDGNWVAAARRHGGHRHSHGYERETLILASDVQACRAYLGDFDGIPGEGGDCSHIDLRGLKAVDMEPRVAYAGQVSLLHESRPLPLSTFRTVVRLNIPGL